MWRKNINPDVLDDFIGKPKPYNQSPHHNSADDLSKQLEQLQKLSNDDKQIIQILRNKLKHQKVKIKDVDLKNHTLERNIESLSLALKQSKLSEKQLEDQHLKEKELQGIIKRLEMELESLRGQFKLMQQKVKQAEDNLELVQKANELKDIIKQWEKKCTDLVQEVAVAKTENQVLQQRIGHLSKELLEYKEQYQKLRNLSKSDQDNLKENRDYIQKMQNDYDMLSEQKQNMENLMKQRLSELQSQLVEERKSFNSQINEQKSIIKDMELEKQGFNKEIENLKLQINGQMCDQNDSQKRIQDLEYKLRVSEEQVKQYQEKIFENKSSVAGLMKQLHDIGQLKAKLSIQSEDLSQKIIKLKNKKNSIFQQNNELQKQIDQYKDNQALEVNNLKQRFETQIQILKDQNSILNTKVARLEKEIDQMKKDYEQRISDLCNQRDTYAQNSDNFIKMQPALKKIQNSIEVLENSLTCLNCMDTLTNPIIQQCGHIICQNCLSDECIECNQPTTNSFEIPLIS